MCPFHTLQSLCTKACHLHITGTSMQLWSSWYKWSWGWVKGGMGGACLLPSCMKPNLQSCQPLSDSWKSPTRILQVTEINSPGESGSMALYPMSHRWTHFWRTLFSRGEIPKLLLICFSPQKPHPSQTPPHKYPGIFQASTCNPANLSEFWFPCADFFFKSSFYVDMVSNSSIIHVLI